MPIDPEHQIFKLSNSMKLPVVFSDPDLPDCPLVHCNPEFERLTGYDKTALIGQNCRILQGAGSDRSQILRIRQAAEKRTFGSAVLLNYRADGTAFNNFLFIEPIALENGKQLLMGCQNEFRDFQSPSETSLASRALLRDHERLRGSFQEYQTIMQDALKMRADTAVLMVKNYLLQKRAER